VSSHGMRGSITTGSSLAKTRGCRLVPQPLCGYGSGSSLRLSGTTPEIEAAALNPAWSRPLLLGDHRHLAESCAHRVR
jgi:hypothetical protein